MRRIFLFQNVSVDGYFEAPGHDISWSKGGNEGFSSETSQEVDTVLFGHRTYDLMRAFWPTPQAAETAPEIAAFMNDRQKLVASHKPFEPGWRNVRVIAGDVTDGGVVGEVRRIKEQPGGTIAMFGSNTLCVSLMEEGLVDEFQLLVNPIALGEGTPLFNGLGKWSELKLAESLVYPSGKVLLTYRA